MNFKGRKKILAGGARTPKTGPEYMTFDLVKLGVCSGEHLYICATAVYSTIQYIGYGKYEFLVNMYNHR